MNCIKVLKEFFHTFRMLTSVLQSAWMSLLKEVFRQLLTEKKKSGQKKKKKVLLWMQGGLYLKNCHLII